MMKMIPIKKIVCLPLFLLALCPLTGCWSYHGINETTIISGVAVDKDELTGCYRLTYEIVDLTKDIKETGVQPKIVEVEGETLFDAARNAKKRLINKLYFGNAQVIVVSQDLAREGLFPIVDWFLRDTQCRETLSLVVSQEKTAKDILTLKGIDEMLVSYEVNKIIEKDGRVTATTKDIELYEIFNTLKAEGLSLVVPAFHGAQNYDEVTTEVNGVGVFKGDRLIGFLTPNETNRYLFVINEIRAGVLTLSLKEEPTDDVSLEVYKNKTSVSCFFCDGRPKARIRVKTEVSLDELGVDLGLLNERKIKKIEAVAARKLEGEIMAVIKKVQAEFGSDIFGFGNRFYKSDAKTWRKISSEWDDWFKTMEVEVHCEISIVNTASLIKN